MTTPTETLRTVRLTAIQTALLFKADKTLKAQVSLVAKDKTSPKPDWYKWQVTPEVAQTMMALFSAMSKAKTSPIKMKLHQHAVCAAAARYLGDTLAGAATVAVLASKHGSWNHTMIRLTKMVAEINHQLDGVKYEDLSMELKAELFALSKVVRA